MAKNRKDKLWFRNKIYGLGWTPRSWEGWGVLLLWLIGFVFLVYFGAKNARSAEDVLLGVLIPVIVMVVMLLIISHLKGEKLEWRWGK